MKIARVARFLGFILLFAACIPATPPANISATPGEFAIITQDSYQNDVFRVLYPTGWRVITSPAGAPPSVTFVAPGNCDLIIVASDSAEQSLKSPSCNQPDIKTTTQTVTLGSKRITVAGSAPSAGWDEFIQAMDRVAASVKAAS
jgi:hypothetical protein